MAWCDKGKHLQCYDQTLVEKCSWLFFVFLLDSENRKLLRVKSARRLEFSTSTAEFSKRLADFCGKPCGF